MKNTKTITFTILFLLFNLAAIAGNKIIKIKTSAICGMCKNRIELVVNNLDGVKKSKLDKETGIIIVKFNTKKLSALDIKIAISETGYDADDIPKSVEAFNVLPNCCKKSGSCSSNH